MSKTNNYRYYLFLLKLKKCIYVRIFLKQKDEYLDGVGKCIRQKMIMQVITSGRTQQLKKTMMKMKNKVYARCKK
jgi:hypothetical protein